MGVNSLWIGTCHGDDSWVLSSCQEFAVVIKLTENKRIDPTDPKTVIFDQFLDRLRDGENTEEDWNTLREKYSIFAMGIDE